MSDAIPPPTPADYARMPNYDETVKRLREENAETGKRLEECAAQLGHVARVMRGEEEDLTGIGAWRILLDMLEQTMGVKMLSQEQCAALLQCESRLAAVLSLCGQLEAQDCTAPEVLKVVAMVRKLAQEDAP